MELARGAVRELGRGPLAGGLLHELAERRVVVEAVERREVAEQVLVRGPAGVDGHELGPGGDRVRVRLREPGLAGAAGPGEDHEASCLHRQVVSPDDVVADQEAGVLVPEVLHDSVQGPCDVTLGPDQRVAHTAVLRSCPTPRARQARCVFRHHRVRTETVGMRLWAGRAIGRRQPRRPEGGCVRRSRCHVPGRNGRRARPPMPPRGRPCSACPPLAGPSTGRSLAHRRAPRT